MRCRWPAAGAQGTCPPSRSPQWQRQPSATWAARGKRLSVPSRPRQGVGTPCGSGTRGASRARPPGARPTSGGSAQSSALPRRRPVVFQKRSARSPTTQHGGNVWPKSATHTAPPGVALPWLRRCRRGGQCTGAGPTVAARGAVTRCAPPRHRIGCLGPGSLGSLAWAAALAGGEDARRAAPCPTGAGRGRLGLSGPGPRPAALPTTARNTAASHPGSRWQAPVRRCTRSRPLRARGPKAPQGVGALARALGGFRGARATEGPVPPSGHPTEGHDKPKARRSPRVAEETPPRGGAPLDRGTRP